MTAASGKVDWLGRLRELEVCARPLNPGAGERRQLLEQARLYVEDFFEQLPTLPAYVAASDEGRGLYEAGIGEAPTSLESLLHVLSRSVDGPGANESSPNFFGFIPGTGLYGAALADYLAAAMNRYTGVYFAAPGAVRLERMLLRSMAGVLGYPEDAGGDLTSGGSIGNLISIVTARDARDVLSGDVARHVVYLSAQTHHSVQKALRIAGVGRCVVRAIELDSRYRMRPDLLAAAVRADRAAGLVPWVLVGSAGTTDTGAVDPSRDLGDVAAEHGLWFHVDGAYGAAFALTDAGRRVLRGLERSDSVIMDPHKGLFLPFGTGIVLVKDRAALQRSQHYTASYLQDTEPDRPDEISPAELSPELTRPFRGLRLWLSLKLAGVARVPCGPRGEAAPRAVLP